MAKLRADLGWTQAELAARVAVSRVALSHLESNLSIASERTVTLLAGVFGLEPHELVAATDYPRGKAERLPAVVARHTEVAHLLAVAAAQFAVADRVPGPAGDRLAAELRDEWGVRLRAALAGAADPEERRRLRGTLRDLAAR